MVGTLTAAIGITAITGRNAAFTGESVLSLASTSQKYVIAAAFTGSGVLGGVGPGQQSRTLAQAGSGTLTTVCKPILRAAPAFTGGGTLTAAGQPGGTRAVAFTSTGQLTAATTIAATGDPPFILTSAVNTSTNTATASVNFPGYTPQMNDVVALWTSCTGDPIVGFVATTPSGWVKLDTSWANITDNGDMISPRLSTGFIYHLVTAGEAAAHTTTYTATNLYAAGSVAKRGVAVVLRNVDPANVIAGAYGYYNNTPVHQFFAGTGLITTDQALVTAYIAKDDIGSYTTPADWSVVVTSNTNFRTGLYQRTALGDGTKVPLVPITPDTGGGYISLGIAFKKNA